MLLSLSWHSLTLSLSPSLHLLSYMLSFGCWTSLHRPTKLHLHSQKCNLHSSFLKSTVFCLRYRLPFKEATKQNRISKVLRVAYYGSLLLIDQGAQTTSNVPEQSSFPVQIPECHNTVWWAARNDPSFIRLFCSLKKNSDHQTNKSLIMMICPLGSVSVNQKGTGCQIVGLCLMPESFATAASHWHVCFRIN